MSKTLEQFIRDVLESSPEEKHFIMRVLDIHPDHLDVSIRSHEFLGEGDTVDFAIAGNQCAPYEEEVN